MSFNFSQDITLISLILAAVALVVAVILATVLMKRIGKTNDANAIDVSAVVQEFNERQKHLEERIIDEKVKLEILELRLASKEELPSKNIIRAVRGTDLRSVSPRQVSVDQIIEKAPSSLPIRNIGVGGGDQRQNLVASESSVRMDATTLEILRAVMDGNGVHTARQIQERIGRSREHTARMMNLLYKEGLVSRDVNARPFTYSVTEAGQSLLNG